MKTDTYRELFFDKQNELLKALQKAIELQEIIKGYEMAIDEVFKAYPLDIFPDTTQAERDAINDNGFISRTSAMMGRHIARVIQERAFHFAREIHEDGQAVEHPLHPTGGNVRRTWEDTPGSDNPDIVEFKPPTSG